MTENLYNYSSLFYHIMDLQSTMCSVSFFDSVIDNQ